MRVIGMGLGAGPPGVRAAAVLADRVFCPEGLVAGALPEGTHCLLQLPERARPDDLCLLFGGPEPDDPWLHWALGQGAEVSYGPSLPLLLGLPPGTQSRHGGALRPWPAAVGVLLYGAGGVPPAALEEAEGALLFHGAERVEGRAAELSAARRAGDFLYLPPLGGGEALAFAGAVAVLRRLRAPGGCPWDREQSHASLLPYLLEEAAELYDALQGGELHEIVEELGDLLLQVLFHAELGREARLYDAEAVAEGLRSKLRRRHPHVFGGEHCATAEELLPRWEELKRAEGLDRPSELSGIPKALSSLAALSQAVGRLRRAGVAGSVGGDFAALCRARLDQGGDPEAEARRELRELERRCLRAEALLGCRLSEAGAAAARAAWERAESSGHG